MEKKQSKNIKIIVPIVLSFFIMGMVDIVGVSTNFVKKDFSLDDFITSFLPFMVFIWFAIFSIPTGILMSSIGRKKTVLLSFIITIIALFIPIVTYTFASMILAFALLGIGNTMLQVSLNPLVASIVNGDKLTSTLTFGQFVKAIASFIGPIVASLLARQIGNWKLIFIIYAIVTIITFIVLYATQVEEMRHTDHRTTFGSVLKTLKNRKVLLLFFGILLIVGIDVCMNTNTPKLLIQKLNYTTETAGIGSSIYFGARTIGAFLGAMLLLRVNHLAFLKINMFVAIVAFLMIMFVPEAYLIYLSIILVGLTCANVFSILFSIALQSNTDSSNEVSSLMIMGIAGGAIITPIAGAVSKLFGIGISFGVLLLCVFYLLFLAYKFSRKTEYV